MPFAADLLNPGPSRAAGLTLKRCRTLIATPTGALLWLAREGNPEHCAPFDADGRRCGGKSNALSARACRRDAYCSANTFAPPISTRRSLTASWNTGATWAAGRPRLPPPMARAWNFECRGYALADTSPFRAAVQDENRLAWDEFPEGLREIWSNIFKGSARCGAANRTTRSDL